jgi:hypothetical protein
MITTHSSLSGINLFATYHLKLSINNSSEHAHCTELKDCSYQGLITSPLSKEKKSWINQMLQLSIV